MKASRTSKVLPMKVPLLIEVSMVMVMAMVMQLVAQMSGVCYIRKSLATEQQSCRLSNSALLLLLAGFGSVMNCRPTSAAEEEQTSSIDCIAPRVGAVSRKLSAQATAPRKVALMCQPVLMVLSLSCSSFTYTVNKAGESTEPCLVELRLNNSDDFLFPQRAQAYCLW